MNLKVTAPLLLVLGIGPVYCSGIFDSAETRIRSVFRYAVGSFDDSYLAGSIEGFAEDYRNETEPRFDRSMLTQALRYAFMRMVDPKTKAFGLRLRLAEESMAVAIDEAAQTASVELTLHLERRRKQEWRPQWQIRVTATMKKIEGDWRIHRSSLETIEGARPR